MSMPFSTSRAATESPEITTLGSEASGRIAQLESMLRRIHSEDVPDETPSDRQFLLFVAGGILCAAPLITFREVLPAIPQHTALPFSPRWMLGICAFRNELMGLVDPAPVLLDDPTASTLADEMLSDQTPGDANAAFGATSGLHTGHTHALVVGEGSRSLALAVQTVLDIVSVDDEEILGLDTIGGPELRCAPKYAAGFIMPRRGEGCYTLVRLDALLSDLLATLEHANAEATQHE